MHPVLNPIAAVTHPDPYPYYDRLVVQQPLYRDDSLGLWIASGATAVAQILDDENCRVRPLHEPVPAALLGSAAASIFRYLVRMNDGARHCPFKQAVVASLASLDAAQVAQCSMRWAGFLSSQMEQGDYAAGLSDFIFQLPVYVTASLLGVEDERLPQVVAWTGEFVRAIAPGSDPQQLARGKSAAAKLLDVFGALLMPDAGAAPGLLAILAAEARRVGRTADDVILANGIGLLSQSYDATAGLIGNTLCNLGRYPELASQVARHANLLPAVIAEVLRFDPPIQNTRRFVAVDGVIAGQAMRAGDVILLVLAAANRDPAVNPEPARFDLKRRNARCFTFGSGSHACPGQRLAAAIAQAGVAQLLASGCEPQALLGSLRYRPSVNARIPQFGAPLGSGAGPAGSAS